eukprot:TRINITY_DN7064_c0_g1_i1.p1 TRINITY_DN7064_c0_g1~~TRINITY_DN7064_c0_g1_i1.p1  ORF type:complete len:110 (+),score=36.72 TRINITY_DN7064_c0_g1_i1:101-430(+)
MSFYFIFFFFFKQKTAYEMLRSLVGSEMCIRDRRTTPMNSPYAPDGQSAWHGDKDKLEEVLAFHGKHRSSEDLLAEFKSQKSRNGNRRHRSEPPASRLPNDQHLSLIHI